MSLTRIQPLLTWRSALCDSDLEPTTRHVALTLSLYMGERGDSAHPGAARIAHDSGLSERSVRTHLGILVDRGWLRVVTRGGLKGAKKVANAYEATIPVPPAPMAVPVPPIPLSPTDAAGASVTREPDAPIDRPPLQLTTRTPEPVADHLSRNSPEPPLPPTASDDRPVDEMGVWGDVLAAMTDRELAQHKGVIRNVTRWRTKVRARLADEHVDQATVLFKRYPTITAAQMADVLLGAPVPRHLERVPCDRGCDRGMISGPDGYRQCECIKPTAVSA